MNAIPIICINLGFLTQFYLFQLSGSYIGSNIHLFQIGNFKQRFPHSHQFTGFGIFSQNSSCYWRYNMTFLQLVLYLRNLNTDRRTLLSKTSQAVVQCRTLSVYLLFKQGYLRFPVIKLFTVSRIFFQQIHYPVPLTNSSIKLLLQRSHLLVHIRFLTVDRFTGSSKLKFLQIKLHCIYNSYLLSCLDYHTFVCTELHKTSISLGRYQNFCCFKCTGCIIFHV